MSTWRRRSLLVCAGASLALLGLPPSGGQARVPWHCSHFYEPRTGAVLAKEVTCLINEVRTRLDRRRLRGNRRLTRAARRYSRWLVQNQEWSHRADGSPAVRAARVGYGEGSRRWKVGEVLVAIDRWSSVFAVWRSVQSASHRRVLLNPRYREIGVGATLGRPFAIGGYTIAIELGRR